MISNRIQEKMTDKTIRRKDMWREIAAEMDSKGYNLGDVMEDKLNNKYKNLERTYKDFLQHMKSTGERRKEPPMFYEKLHQLFGEKHKNLPVSVSDTSQQKDSSNDSTRIFGKLLVEVCLLYIRHILHHGPIRISMSNSFY